MKNCIVALFVFASSVSQAGMCDDALDVLVKQAAEAGKASYRASDTILDKSALNNYANSTWATTADMVALAKQACIFEGKLKVVNDLK